MNRFALIVLLVTILVSGIILLNPLSIIILYIISSAALARDFASGKYRGACWHSGNCADICIGREGATDGHCHVFKCWCENNRGKRSLIDHLREISGEQMYQAHKEEMHYRFG
jgi:Gamma-thionin family